MPSPRFTLSEFLPYRLAVLSERVSRRLSVVYQVHHGLTVAEWRVLVHLNRHQPVSVRDIQASVNLEKSRVSRAVTRLVTAGLVQKSPGDRDGRLVQIALAPAGVAALADILPRASAVEQALTDSFSEAELTQLSALMEKLHGVLDSDPLAAPRSPMDTAGG